MTIDAMKQALKALEELNKASIGVDAVPLPGEIDTAMDALRTAIEKEELIQRAEEAFAASEQKPVAWFHTEKYKTHFTTNPSEDMIGKYWQPLYTAPGPNEDYERGFIDGMREQMKTSVDRAVNAIDRAVNATCKREWVGLTDDEWKQIWIEFDSLDVENDFQDYMAGKYGAGHYIDNELYWNFQKGVIEQIVNNKLQRKDGTYKDDK